MKSRRLVTSRKLAADGLKELCAVSWQPRRSRTRRPPAKKPAQSITDAGSLNTFGRNEIEVAPISSALLRIACLVILYKTCKKNGLGVASGEEWFARTLCERAVT